jgi:Gram-negative bacterial TonB protein C-terminal
VHPLLDEEALRVVSNMGKWIPGEKDGEKTSVYFTLPIKFRLQ